MNPIDRLDSWKEIAAYLKRGVRTAQRWEHAGLPIRRVATDRGVVYAFQCEIDAWWAAQSPIATTGKVPNAPAYDAYLKARNHTRYSAMQVRSFLGEAIALDPGFALPHAHLATYFFTLVAVGLMAPDQGLTAARASARRALDLDPSLAEAEAVLATIAGVQDFAWCDAETFSEGTRARAGCPASTMRVGISPLWGGASKR